MNATEALIWERWRSGGDADAFAEILSRHGDMVFPASKRILGNATDAEDITQECFLELMQTSARIRSLAAWLYTTAVRRSLDLLRRTRRRLHRERRAASSARAETDPETEEILARVDEAIAELPERLRVPVVYRFLEGKTHQEIANALGTSASTAQYRVEKGLERVRRTLNRRGVRVATATLTAVLGTELVEATPAALVARLGKLAMAGGARTASAAAKAGAATSIPHALLLVGGAMKTKLGVLGALFLLLAVAISKVPDLSRPAAGPGPVAGESAGGNAVVRRRAFDVQVVWEGDQEPVAGATVFLHREGDPNPRAIEAVTDAAGRASLECPAEWSAAAVEARHPGAPSCSQAIDLAASGNVTLALAARTLTGIIRDASSGRPLPRARINIDAREALADGEGRYRLRGVPRGEAKLSVSAQGYVEEAAAVEIAQDGENRQDFQLEPQLVRRD